MRRLCFGGRKGYYHPYLQINCGRCTDCSNRIPFRPYKTRTQRGL